MSGPTVRDIMIRGVESVSPDRPVHEAVTRMLRQDLPAVPVVGESGEVLGIVAESDVMRATLSAVPRPNEEGGGESGGASPPELRVDDVMGRSVLCVSETLGLDEAANKMINKDVTQLPVVREGKLSGFVTRRAILRELFGH